MTLDELDKAITAAARRVAAMDEADHRNGNRTPLESGLGPWSQAVLSALTEGLMGGDQGPLFDALCMLRQLQRKLERGECPPITTPDCRRN